jgi:proteasome assembly chaperone (PAC2) family protein
MVREIHEYDAASVKGHAMTTMTLDLSPDTYQRLLVEARQRGAPVEAVAEKLLAEQLAGVHLSERDRATAVLRAAGLLTELSPEEKERAACSTLMLEEARAILDRAGSKPLSEVILEMRGPKE